MSGSSIETLIQRFDPSLRIVRAWDLKGGVSAQVTGLECELASGGRRRFVAKKHGAMDLERNPDVARHEFEVLEIARSHGIPAPKPLAWTSPYLLLEFVDGSAEAPDDADRVAGQIANYLRQIHAIPAEGLMHLPPIDDSVRYEAQERRGDLTFDKSLGMVLRACLPTSRRRQLLHGDLWPGNPLWRGDEIASILDWEDAAIGDPLADLATSRVEMCIKYGLRAARILANRHGGFDPSELAPWDLWATLRVFRRIPSWGLDREQESRTRARLESFALEAMALASQ